MQEECAEFCKDQYYSLELLRIKQLKDPHLAQFIQVPCVLHGGRREGAVDFIGGKGEGGCGFHGGGRFVRFMGRREGVVGLIWGEVLYGGLLRFFGGSLVSGFLGRFWVSG